MHELIKKIPDRELDITDVQSLTLSLLTDIDENSEQSANMTRVKVEALRLLSDTIKTKNKQEENAGTDEDDILIALRRKK